MNPPELTADQRAAAVAKSAAARQSRSELRAGLRSGDIAISEAIEKARNDPSLGKMKVTTLLESVPGVGPIRARTVMAEAGIAESRRIRGLGPHQIVALAQRFG